MRVRSVEIKNFRGFGENPNDPEGLYRFKNLDSDLTLISGSNGYGKTSFFEAVEWALTDSISRIKKLNSVYHANTLQNKSTLKFVSPNRNCNKEREVVVIVEFNNGTIICRKSTDKFIKITEKGDYKSEVKIRQATLNGEKIDRELPPIFNENTFLKNHFLMQESISSFFTSNSPVERSEQIMELLDIDQLNDIYRKTDNLIQGASFSDKKTDLSDQIKEQNSAIKELEETIKGSKFESVNQYKDSLSTFITNISEENIQKEQDLHLLYNQVLEKSVYKEKYDLLDEIKNKINQKLTNYSEQLSNQTGFIGLVKKYSSLQKIKANIEREKKLYDLKKIKSEENLLRKSIKEHQLKRLKKLNGKVNNQFRRQQMKIPKIDINTNDYVEKYNKLKSFLSRLNKYTGHIPKDSTLIENLSNIDFDTKIQDYKKTLTNIEKNSSFFNTLDEQYQKESELEKEYETLLDEATSYIQNNRIEECPVCLSTDFPAVKKGKHFSLEDSNELLLSTISKIKGKGKKRLGDIVERLQNYKGQNENLKRDKENLEQHCDELVKKSKEEIERIDKFYKTEYNDKVDRITKLDNTIQEELDQYTSNIDKYKILKEELKVSSSTELTEAISSIRKVINEQAQYLVISKDSTKSDVEALLIEVNQTLSERYNEEIDPQDIRQSIEKIEKEIKRLNASLKNSRTIIEKMKGLEKYELTNRQFESLENYDSLESKIANLNEHIKTIEEYKAYMIKLRRDLDTRRNKYITHFVHDQPIIEWIYSMISPHRYYKELNLITKNKKLNITDKDEKVYLDHIFSSAQLNVLSLSIFLGMGLTFRKNKLNNLFIDDPIQSLDDINVLSLIDIFRALPKSNYRDIKLIISSHNDQFTQLLSIKMRNHNFTHYKMVDYGEEGPVFERLS